MKKKKEKKLFCEICPLTYEISKSKEVCNSIIQCVAFKEQKINEKIKETIQQETLEEKKEEKEVE